MQAYLSLVLHAHLPFIRHPEHDKSLEETWLFEAITETYVPILRVLDRWQAEGIAAPLTLTLTPTLCAMLQDPLLQARYAAHLDGLIDLSEKEIHRTRWEKPFNRLASLYYQRFSIVRDYWQGWNGDLLGAFRRLQESGALEIITSAASHAILPLLLDHPPSIRAQILTARDHYRGCFGRDPVGIWLPECAYDQGIEPFVKEAGFRWFITDTHGMLNARPKPRFGIFAPLLTPHFLAVFGRDQASARQVWSRDEGYPGDPRYRDFYRDIGFDLDLDYVGPYLPAPDRRTFTGIKYYRITGRTNTKAVYDPDAARQAADDHAGHFLEARVRQLKRAAEILQRPPLVLAPYDAELYGHWWYEGPEFLDLFVRKAFYDQKVFTLTTPEAFLRQYPTHQVASPAASSWGEEGYWGMWLNEKTQWLYPHLRAAQDRLTDLARRFSAPDGAPARSRLPGRADSATSVEPVELQQRALRQAGRELLLAQASDWPFILRAGTSPGYATNRFKTHILRFNHLCDQIIAGPIDQEWLTSVESSDNLFPDLDVNYWK